MKKIILWIMGVIIFSGLPIVGWGLQDATGFVQNPARCIFIIMMALLSLWVVIYVPSQGRKAGKEGKKVKSQDIVVLFLQIIPLVLVLAAPFSDRHGWLAMNDSNIIRYSGLGIVFIGFILMNVAVIYLDKQFSVDVTIQENHKLIISGPYHYVRHPRYLGIILFLTGISLVFISWAALILSLATLVVLLWRIRDEEALMQREFTKDWEAYRKKTYYLVPFVF